MAILSDEHKIKVLKTLKPYSRVELINNILEGDSDKVLIKKGTIGFKVRNAKPYVKGKLGGERMVVRFVGVKELRYAYFNNITCDLIKNTEILIS